MMFIASEVSWLQWALGLLFMLLLVTVLILMLMWGKFQKVVEGTIEVREKVAQDFCQGHGSPETGETATWDESVARYRCGRCGRMLGA